MNYGRRGLKIDQGKGYRVNRRTLCVGLPMEINPVYVTPHLLRVSQHGTFIVKTAAKVLIEGLRAIKPMKTNSSD